MTDKIVETSLYKIFGDNLHPAFDMLYVIYGWVEWGRAQHAISTWFVLRDTDGAVAYLRFA